MPCYELSLVLKAVPRNELKTIIIRTAQYIFDEDGIIRQLQNLGPRQTPYKLRSHSTFHSEGHYYLMKFDAKIPSLENIKDDLKRDLDVIRAQVHPIGAITEIFSDKEEPECTIWEDMLPPSDRPSVKDLIAVMEAKKKKNRYVFNKLPYHPF